LAQKIWKPDEKASLFGLPVCPEADSFGISQVGGSVSPIGDRNLRFLECKSTNSLPDNCLVGDLKRVSDRILLPERLIFGLHPTMQHFECKSIRGSKKYYYLQNLGEKEEIEKFSKKK
jgi:hypothetical protein